MASRMSRNFGQHAATLCGISKTRGEWIITLDDDLEHKPEHIPQLYEKAHDGYDLVYAVYPERSHAWWRNVTSDIGRRLLRIAIPNLNHQYSSFRCISKRSCTATITIRLSLSGHRRLSFLGNE